MSRFLCLLSLLVAAATISVAPVHAHGEAGEDLAEFHKHIDDYRADVERLIGEADAIVEVYREGGDAEAGVQSLIESWEEVGIHAAIETRATILYPLVWQAVLGLMQAVEGDAGVEQVRAAAADIGAALWQGLGGVRLAAFQVEQGQAVAAPTPAHAGGGAEQIAQIRTELEQALEAYAAGDLKRAEMLVHDAYMKRFEYLEGDLIGQDAELVEDLELDFNARLPQLMQQGAKVAALRDKLDDMFADLDRAAELLARAEADRPKVF